MGVSISHLPSIFSILAFLLPYFPPGFLSSFLHYFLPFLPLSRLPFFLTLFFLPSPFLPSFPFPSALLSLSPLLYFCLTFPLSFPPALLSLSPFLSFSSALLSLSPFFSSLPSNPSVHHIVHYRLCTLCISVFYRCWYGLCLCRY